MIPLLFMWCIMVASQTQRIMSLRGTREFHVPVQSFPAGTIVALQNTNIPGFGQNIWNFT